MAVEQQGKVLSIAKESVDHASSTESDKSKELFVNPGILTLAHQRGELDCGGTKYVLIRYGNFFQYVRRWREGHISICIQPDSDVSKLIPVLEKCLTLTPYGSRRTCQPC